MEHWVLRRSWQLQGSVAVVLLTVEAFPGRGEQDSARNNAGAAPVNGGGATGRGSSDGTRNISEQGPMSNPRPRSDVCVPCRWQSCQRDEGV